MACFVFAHVCQGPSYRCERRRLFHHLGRARSSSTSYRLSSWLLGNGNGGSGMVLSMMGFIFAENHAEVLPTNRLKRIHRRQALKTKITSLPCVSSHCEPAFPGCSPPPFPNDSNSAKCLTHALSYSPKCINNAPFLLVTNITASTKPPPSHNTFFNQTNCTL